MDILNFLISMKPKRYKLIKYYPGCPPLGTITEGKTIPKWYLYDPDVDVPNEISVEELSDFPDTWQEIE
jgi:hypothetical protein